MQNETKQQITHAVITQIQKDHGLVSKRNSYGGELTIETIAEFCQGCTEHLREHGDCVHAGEPAALKCPVVLKYLKRGI